MIEPTPLRLLMIERTMHVNHLKSRVAHADYAVNPRAPSFC